MKYVKDPKITVKDALELVDNNQSRLAGVLGITRQSVNDWLSKERIYLPTLQAYRLKELMHNKGIDFKHRSCSPSLIDHTENNSGLHEQL